MTPRHRSTSGYRGVNACPNGTFYAEIRNSAERIGLGTFETAHEATRAYDVVAWRLDRSRRTMNFHDVRMREQAESLAPPPPAVTRKQQQRQHELEKRIVKAELDQRFRLEWARQFPEDVAVMESFYEKKAAAKATKKADREERREKSAARKKEREEKDARKAKEKKNGVGPLTIVLSSSSFEWTSTPVSSRTLGSSDFD